MAFGVPLVEVVKMVTSNAAILLGFEGQIGTLAPGAETRHGISSVTGTAGTAKRLIGACEDSG